MYPNENLARIDVNQINKQPFRWAELETIHVPESIGKRAPIIRVHTGYINSRGEREQRIMTREYELLESGRVHVHISVHC